MRALCIAIIFLLNVPLLFAQERIGDLYKREPWRLKVVPDTTIQMLPVTDTLDDSYKDSHYPMGTDETPSYIVCLVTQESWYMNKDRFRKITAPYSVFPYVPIGEWPFEKLWKDKQFSLPIKKVIQLTETAISDEDRQLIDSLKIELVTIPIFKDNTSVDLNLLFDALNIIHDSERSGNQVLIICDSQQYLLSKLLGECYHFQKSREIVKRNDFELLDKYSSALKCFCEEGYTSATSRDEEAPS